MAQQILTPIVDWLDHSFDSFRWVAISSLTPFSFFFCSSSFSFSGCCGVVGEKEIINPFDVRNTIAGSHTEHG
jgi:hypothetical protein